MKIASRTTLARGADVRRQWYVVDAADQVLGRLATRIATVLMGKHKPTYTPHVDTGDFVIVVNADRVRVTGRKLDSTVYMSYSGYPSGHKRVSMRQMFERHPERVLEAAVRRMLPKSALGRRMLLKLKLYAGDKHPHQAQQPIPLT